MKEPPKRYLVALVYLPDTFMTSPKLEAQRSIARAVDISEKVLDRAPAVGSSFLIESREYICLRVQEAFVPEGFTSVIYAAKA